MKLNRIKTWLACGLMLAAGLASTANAVVINITVDSSGNWLQNGAAPVGANSLASKEFYSSFVGSTANNKEDNLKFLQGVIGNWNAAFDPNLNSANSFAALAGDNGSIGGLSSYTVPAGYEYVVLHFGNGQAGAGGGPRNDDENGWWAAWYLGGAETTFNAVPQEGSPLENVGGFSSARVFNKIDPPSPNVPDGGSTIALLGVSMIGINWVRRKILKA